MLQKLLLLGLLLLTLSWLACTKNESKELSQDIIDLKVDSILKKKEKTLQQQAQDDLNRRMRIELKPKVDSILGRTINPDSLKVPKLDTSGTW